MLLQIIAASQGPLLYFHQSNLAGKCVVILLMASSIAAWTVMAWKFIELSSLRRQNQNQKRTIIQNRSFCGVPLSDNKFVDGTLSYVFHQGLIAYHNEVRIFEPPKTEITRNRCMSHIENAMSRAIANISIQYESHMTTLGSIVTAAPFLGLFGTVYGVMDAFGAVADGGNATLQHLAPGVSGALLTTVAALGVAIPSVIGYNYIVSYMKAMIVELENDSSELAERFEIEISMGN